jgi:hypothetical protein
MSAWVRAGEPWEIKKAVCLHEEDGGILWKHMEYRNGHAEVRRSRRLVLSFVATVVNYEYCFYWYFYQVRTFLAKSLQNALALLAFLPGPYIPAGCILTMCVRVPGAVIRHGVSMCEGS